MSKTFLQHWGLGETKIQWTFILGVALMISTTMSLLVIETVAGCTFFANDDYKITIPCIGNGTLSMVLTFIGW